MFVLNISFLTKNKLNTIIILSAIIATVLTFISLFIIIKSPNNTLLKKIDLFELTSYYAEYEITEISNKNRNIYLMKELYKKEDINEYFRFEYKDALNNDIAYIVNNDKIKIENNLQIANYYLENNKFRKTHLYSISTYLEIINNIDNIDCIKLNISEDLTEENEIKKYELVLDKQTHNSKHEIEHQYSDFFSEGLKISKIELEISDNTPISVLVYLDDGSIYLSIKYINFEINKDISTDIFNI